MLPVSRKGERMPGRRADRGKVRTTWEWGSYSDMNLLAGGYALPRYLHTVAYEDPDLPGVEIRAEVEITGGRARAIEVTVASPGGVGWAMLSKVPVRDIVGTAVLAGLHRATTPDVKGRLSYEPISSAPADELDVDEIRQIVQRSVGYRQDLDRFEQVAS
jgi:hypothetical protein